MPLVTLADTGERFDAEDGETILAAAQRAALGFPYSCQAGNCGSCKCELVEGEVFELEYSEYALPAAERARNLILACRSQVWGDTVLRRLDDEDLVMHPSRIMRCAVIGLHDLTHDIKRVRLRNDDPGAFAFSAGQYVQLDFAPGLGRHYSMANRPDEPTLEFHIRRMADGRASRHVSERLALGDAVTVSGPLGSAHLRDRHVGPVLMLAGGSGLAPIQSILATMLERRCTAPIRLWFGVRAERDVYNEALLADWARTNPNFSYEIVLSGPDASSGRARGFVHEVAAASIASVEGAKAYLAGPPVMVEAASAMLAARGMAARDIHADAFYNQP